MPLIRKIDNRAIPQSKIFNPCDLNLSTNSIFIVEQNACYYTLGDMTGDGSLVVDGTLQVGGGITITGTITGSGIIL